MKELFEKYNISINENQLEKFKKYKELLIFYNNQFNITSITEEKDIYIKHFIDSLLIVDKLKTGKMIDVGSGGGFPALPIKIMSENIDVTLLEATGKKCTFLETVVKELDFKNVKVLNGRAEDYSKNTDYREAFDICTARAVARLNTLTEYCLPFVKVGGKFFAFKGETEEELNEAKNAIKILGGTVKKVNKFELEDAKRDIIEIEKIEKTPSRYPRGNGKERKNPL